MERRMRVLPWRLRRLGIEKHIQRRDLSIADDDHIQACLDHMSA